MTTDQYIAKMNKQIEEIIRFDRPLLMAVRSVMALQSIRIFLNGVNKNGSKIGNYITRDYYINPKTFKNKTGKSGSFPLKGKSGETKFKNGEPHKTGYFPSFLAFKKTINLSTRFSTVDLFLSGELHRHWANGEVRGKAEARKISVRNYIVAISEKDLKKIERYGNVFGLSTKEKSEFLRVAKFELAKALR